MFVDFVGMDEDEEEAVPLPNVNSAILKKVIQWATYHKDDPPPPEDDENKEKRTDDISSWDADFLKVDQGTLFELILVRFLDGRVLGPRYVCGEQHNSVLLHTQTCKTSYSTTNKMHLFLKLFILVKLSTCFGRSFRPSSGAQNCTYGNKHMSSSSCLTYACCHMCSFELVMMDGKTARNM